MRQLVYYITCFSSCQELFYLIFKFFLMLADLCISNSDIISCLQFPVNTFFIFFSTLFNHFFVVCQKKSASFRSGFIISLFSLHVKYYFTFFYNYFGFSILLIKDVHKYLYQDILVIQIAQNIVFLYDLKSCFS